MRVTDNCIELRFKVPESFLSIQSTYPFPLAVVTNLHATEFLKEGSFAEQNYDITLGSCKCTLILLHPGVY